MARIFKPDYRGRGIINLMASIAGRFGHRSGYPFLVDLPPLVLERYRKIVLVVIDGLGWKFLLRQPDGGFLKSHLCGWMTSVFPATTASAITTFATGAAPAEHGVTGWFTYLREIGSVAKMLFSMPRHGGSAYSSSGIPMSVLIKAQPLFKKLRAQSFVITPDDIASGDFSRAMADGAEVLSYKDLNGFCQCIVQALEVCAKTAFVPAYWPDLDSICHHHGIGSPKAGEHFQMLDIALGKLIKEHGGRETLFIITADHGLVDTPSERFIELDRYPLISECLSLPLCGEPRMAYCYLHSDMAAIFRLEVRKHLAHACRIYSRRYLIENGFFGAGDPQPWFHHRVGDLVLSMDMDYSLGDRLVNEDRSPLAAGHGGLSADEMLVPLILVSKN